MEMLFVRGDGVILVRNGRMDDRTCVLKEHFLNARCPQVPDSVVSSCLLIVGTRL